MILVFKRIAAFARRHLAALLVFAVITTPAAISYLNYTSSQNLAAQLKRVEKELAEQQEKLASTISSQEAQLKSSQATIETLRADLGHALKQTQTQQQSAQDKIGALQQKLALFEKTQTNISTDTRLKNLETIARGVVQLTCTRDILGIDVKSGSGTVLDASGEILTNYHAVSTEDGSAPLCMIGFLDDVTKPPTRFYFANLTNYSAEHDLAVLKIFKPAQGTEARSNFQVAVDHTCSRDDLKIGERVTILGFPSVGGKTLTVTEGIISGFDGQLVKTSAKIEQGNSGGTAIASSGCYIGPPTLAQRGRLESLGYITIVAGLVK